ncbi:MAG: hypothetical protein AAF603_04250 [Pseudomonadota bacterium]
MKKTKIHILSIFLGALASWFGLSSANASCGVNGCTAKIDRIYAKSNGDILVNTEGDETQANCTPPGNIYLTIPWNNTARDTFLAMLLSAKAQDKRLNIRIFANSPDCEVNYITMDD